MSDMSVIRNSLKQLMVGASLCVLLAACSSHQQNAKAERMAPVEEVEVTDSRVVAEGEEGNAPATVASKPVADDGSFEVASVSDSTLSEMRGGFITVGGLKFNFAFTSATSINDKIQSQIALSTEGLKNLPSTIQQLVQSGLGNQIQTGNDNQIQSTTSTPAPAVASSIASSSPAPAPVPSPVSVPVPETPVVVPVTTIEPVVVLNNVPGNVNNQVQSAVGNQAVAAASTASPVTIFTTVQNTLNNQTIVNRNQLDLTVNNVAVYRNMQAALNGRFAAAMR